MFLSLHKFILTEALKDNFFYTVLLLNPLLGPSNDDENSCSKEQADRVNELTPDLAWAWTVYSNF